MSCCCVCFGASHGHSHCVCLFCEESHSVLHVRKRERECVCVRIFFVCVSAVSVMKPHKRHQKVNQWDQFSRQRRAEENLQRREKQLQPSVEHGVYPSVGVNLRLCMLHVLRVFLSNHEKCVCVCVCVCVRMLRCV